MEYVWKAVAYGLQALLALSALGIVIWIFSNPTQAGSTLGGYIHNGMDFGRSFITSIGL